VIGGPTSLRRDDAWLKSNRFRESNDASVRTSVVAEIK
jgi:hypothetical protein